VSDWHEIAYTEFATGDIEYRVGDGTHTPVRLRRRRQKRSLCVEALAMYGLLSLVIHAVVVYEVLR
jgi:hypothetical protein